MDGICVRMSTHTHGVDLYDCLKVRLSPPSNSGSAITVSSYLPPIWVLGPWSHATLCGKSKSNRILDVICTVQNLALCSIGISAVLFLHEDIWKEINSDLFGLRNTRLRLLPNLHASNHR